MATAYEFTTWHKGGKWDEMNQEAIKAGKSFSGSKFTVTIGQWGTRSFIVLGAEDKKAALEAAKSIVTAEAFEAQYQSKSRVVDVTNSKKYN